MKDQNTKETNPAWGLARFLDCLRKMSNAPTPDTEPIPDESEPGRFLFGGECVHEAWLPFELTNGNDGRGKSWYKPAKQRKEFETKLAILGQKRQPFDFPVVVHVTRILGKNQRLWDSASILRGNYKELEDALVALGWFHDDNTKWIPHTWPFQNADRRGDGPAILLEVFRR